MAGTRSWATGACAAALALVMTGCLAYPLPQSTSRQEAPLADAAVVLRPSGSLTLDGSSVSQAELGGALIRRAQTLHADAARSGEPFRGRLSISLPPEADSGTLLTMIEQAAAAGFSKPWLLVRDPGGRTWGIGLTVPTASTRTALKSTGATPDPDAKVQAGFANPVVRMDPSRGVVVSARDEVVDPGGEGLTIACSPVPCQAWPTAELNRLIRRMKLDHPRDRAIMVVPHDSVPVQDLVDVLDATRDDSVTARGTRTLMPQAVLARGDGP